LQEVGEFVGTGVMPQAANGPRRHVVPEFRALREYSHALRLENASLRESLSDGFAANANRIRCARGARSPSSMKEW